MISFNSAKQNTEYGRIRYIRQNTPEYARRRLFGGVVLLILALLFCRLSAPANAQGFVTPTPLPAIVATQQAANQKAQQAAASNAEADRLDAQAAEIRRNADVQAQQAAQAYADARAASAAQNAAAIGEAIGRGEAAATQLKASLDGILSINSQQSEIINSLYISLTQQGAELIQAHSEITQLKKTNADLNATNEMVVARIQDSERSASVLSIIPIFIAFLFLVGLIGFGAWLWQKRNGHDAPPAIGMATPNQNDDDPIEGEIEE